MRKYLSELFNNPKYYAFSISFIFTSSITGLLISGSLDGLLGHTIWPVAVFSNYTEIPHVLSYLIAISALIVTGFVMGAVCVLDIKKKYLYPLIVFMFFSVVIASVFSILKIHAMIVDSIIGM